MHLALGAGRSHPMQGDAAPQSATTAPHTPGVQHSATRQNRPAGSWLVLGDLGAARRRSSGSCGVVCRVQLLLCKP